MRPGLLLLILACIALGVVLAQARPARRRDDLEITSLFALRDQWQADLREREREAWRCTLSVVAGLASVAYIVGYLS